MRTERINAAMRKIDQAQYAKYEALAQKIPFLTCCGRLADFKYYNMDQALKRALEIGVLLSME